MQFDDDGHDRDDDAESRSFAGFNFNAVFYTVGAYD